MSQLLAQHQAHKARTQRFAAAAVAYRNKADNTVDARQISILKRCVKPLVVPIRRQYEKPAITAFNAPMTWRIFNAVSAEFDLPVSRIIGRRRHKRYTLPRFVMIGLLIELTNMSLPAIGRRLGGRDHTTIINGRRRLGELLEGEAFRNRFEQIKAGIKAGLAV